MKKKAKPKLTPKSRLRKAIEETRKDMIAGGLWKESPNVEDIEDESKPSSWQYDFAFIKAYDEDKWYKSKNIKSLEICEAPHPEIYRDEETGKKRYVYRVLATFDDGSVDSLTKETSIRSAAQYELQCLIEIIWDFGMDNCVWRESQNGFNNE